MDDTDTNNNISGPSFESSDNNTNAGSMLLLPPSTTGSTIPPGPLAYLKDDDDDDDDTDMDLQNDSPKRRKQYASGLANLGNTCFMNSTLQCLAHTDPLRRYFLSRDYQSDLNRDNPLGTGGELATQFSKLLQGMWVDEPSSASAWNNSDVVYPREFKQALGKHASQFMGYDQHDSQEFATYLLDALHEDTNRITKKPYIEKPEQKEGETDDQGKEWLVCRKLCAILPHRCMDSHLSSSFLFRNDSGRDCMEAPLATGRFESK